MTTAEMAMPSNRRTPMVMPTIFNVVVRTGPDELDCDDGT
jgi:hypothetical protein